MDLRATLKRQYHLGFQMLRDCVTKCPESLWLEGEAPRRYWRIAYHATYYTHLYLGPSAEAFVPWEHHRKGSNALWGKPADKPYSRDEILAYVNLVDAQVDALIEALDLDEPTSGFGLYKMPKVDVLILNLRHQQGHIGQLSERLMDVGIEVTWAGMN